MDIGQVFVNLAEGSGFAGMTWGNFVMIVVALVFLYLGIAKKFEPLLLVGIAFGMLLTNLPQLDQPIYHPEWWTNEACFITGADGLKHIDYVRIFQEGGLLDLLYIGVKTGIYPCLIFVGVGAMTDFGPMIANPKSLLLGAAAQLGVFAAFIMAICFGKIPAIGFTPQDAASIGIIGGADGPTAIYLTSKLAPALLPAIAVAAYSYMALIPIIQPPLMKLIVPKKERMVKMEQLREVSKREKIVFPIMVTVFTVLLIPSVAPLLGCLMFGNLLKETGVTDRLSDTAQNALMNIVTLFLGISVGATAQAATFLSLQTLGIIVLGLIAFAFSTVGGLLLGRVMYWITKGKINPLIGAAGVSAVPMAARVAHSQGLKDNPDNYLLMHAMGPNVAGVIGSAVAAGILLAVFGA